MSQIDAVADRLFDAVRVYIDKRLRALSERGGTKKVVTRVTEHDGQGRIRGMEQLEIDDFQIGSILARLDALEARASTSYRGIWSAEAKYHRGDTVTRDGSLYHCNVVTTRKPGETTDWQLMSKTGKPRTRPQSSNGASP